MRTVPVRSRSEADVVPCARMARTVHAEDGYPAFLPTDFADFLADGGAVAAWVAERDNTIVGHVALHPRSSDAVMAMASTALGLPGDRLGVVARLLVSRDARRGGVGHSLLATAANEAVARGLAPILDVAVRYQPAIDLYESAGWLRAGRVTVHFDDGGTLDEYVYLGPAANSPA